MIVPVRTLFTISGIRFRKLGSGCLEILFEGFGVEGVRGEKPEEESIDSNENQCPREAHNAGKQHLNKQH